MTAQDLKNSILQLAVQGKLVPQDPSDEPASKLLKRIEAEKAKLIKDGKIKKEKPSPVIADEEKPFDIPENWCWIRLNDICSIVTGKKDANFASENGKYNFFTCAKDPLLCDSFSFCGESLLLAGNGDISNISYFAGEFEAYQRTYVLQPYIEYAYLRYLFYHLQYNWVDYNGDKTFGSAIPYIRLGNVQNYLVALPPLAEQKRIVAKIEELMPLVEEYGKTEERIKALNAEFPDKLRKSILQQAVQGKLTERDPSDEPASELLKRIRAEKAKLIAEGKIKKGKTLPAITDEEKPFDIPDTWEWVRFADIMMLISTGPFGSMLHKSDYVTNGIPLVNPANIINAKIVPSEKMMVSAETANRLSSYKLSQGMIVMGRRGEMGRCAEVSENEKGWLCGTGSFFMEPSTELFVAYLITFFSSPYAKTYLGGASIGATMNNLNHDILKNIPVPLPPFAEQKRIVARVEELLAACDGLK